MKKKTLGRIENKNDYEDKKGRKREEGDITGSASFNWW